MIEYIYQISIAYDLRHASVVACVDPVPRWPENFAEYWPQQSSPNTCLLWGAALVKCVRFIWSTLCHYEGSPS